MIREFPGVFSAPTLEGPYRGSRNSRGLSVPPDWRGFTDDREFRGLSVPRAAFPLVGVA